jgi:hypothetical protein
MRRSLEANVKCHGARQHKAMAFRYAKAQFQNWRVGLSCCGKVDLPKNILRLAPELVP